MADKFINDEWIESIGGKYADGRGYYFLNNWNDGSVDVQWHSAKRLVKVTNGDGRVSLPEIKVQRQFLCLLEALCIEATSPVSTETGE
jgi:hypothetical protein